MGKKKQNNKEKLEAKKLETKIEGLQREKLETKIRLVGSLHFMEQKDNSNIGSDKYFARLYLGIISSSEKIPEGVKVTNFPDYIELELPKTLYYNLKEENRTKKYGSVTIELAVNDK